MNDIKTQIPKPRPKKPAQRRLSPEERERIIKERRKKKTIKKIKKAIVFVLCASIIAVCANLVVREFMKEDTIPEVTPSGKANVSEDAGTNNPGKEGFDLFAEGFDKQKGKNAAEYSAISYYKEENAERYDIYSQENPQFSADEVVWRVNANQDMPKYEYDISVSGYDINMIVNKYYFVPEDYRPNDLVLVDDQYVRKEAADNFKKMQSDALEEGLKIRAVSGYRTVLYQRDLYNRYLSGDTRENVDRYSARPGYSEHHTGLAIDIFGSKEGLREFENTPEYPWVKENCYKYGFIIRYLKETEDITGYEAEPWHIRYVGKDISTDMKEKNINNYEEYYAKYID